MQRLIDALQRRADVVDEAVALRAKEMERQAAVAARHAHFAATVKVVAEEAIAEKAAAAKVTAEMLANERKETAKEILLV